MSKKNRRQDKRQERNGVGTALVRVKEFKRDGVAIRTDRNNHIALSSGLSKYVTFVRA